VAHTGIPVRSMLMDLSLLWLWLDRQVDPDGERTLGVLTKPDLVRLHSCRKASTPHIDTDRTHC
jgi:hypothetical protein